VNPLSEEEAPEKEFYGEGDDADDTDGADAASAPSPSTPPALSPPAPPAVPQFVGEEGVLVEQGQCVFSLAHRAGQSWKRIWDHPKNATLRQARHPGILLPGDRLYLPPVEPREVSCATGSRHTFVLQRAAAPQLRLTLRRTGVARAGLAYELQLDSGETLRGTSDGQGQILQPLPAAARQGRLVLQTNPPEELRLLIGELDPVETVSGAQARLSHLGYYQGRVDGDLGPRTSAALRAFQQGNGLPETGTFDAATRSKLETLHGS
jgi:Putative peptidoglycan binding domain